MTRLDSLAEAARPLGLFVRTYSPGDGLTRYRFFTVPTTDYFGPESGIFTALGLKEARTFVEGYRLGKSS